MSKYLLNISGQETGVLLVVIAGGICVNKDFIEKCYWNMLKKCRLKNKKKLGKSTSFILFVCYKKLKI